MKVKDLIAQLNKLNQNLEVFCYDDGMVVALQSHPGPFEITAVESQFVVRSRDANRRALVKFGPNSEEAREVAIISITSDV